MQITNKHNLPPAIFMALCGMHREPQDVSISATELTMPPMIRHLRRKHWDEIEEDASDRLWALLGQACHHVFAKHGQGEVEKFLKAEIDGTLITGTCDHLIAGEIHDYKITSVYSYLFGDKPDWIRQLNIYRWLAEKNGYNVQKLKVYAILRDHQSSKVMDEDYPPIPFVCIDIPLWTLAETENYIRLKIAQFKAARPCTPEETWERPPTFACMKAGRKSAIRVFDTQEAAQEFCDKNNQKLTIEFRQGSRPRCERYCNVSVFCEQGVKNV